jgi:hypothetical protein
VALFAAVAFWIGRLHYKQDIARVQAQALAAAA